MKTIATVKQNKYTSTWSVRGGRVLSPAPFSIVGIVNITPDSFSDGGKYIQVEEALACIEKMVHDGVSIVDIGAESTRPYSKPVLEKEEQARILPVISKAKKLFPDLVVSIDTYKASTAKKALELGVDIINDISGCTFDEALVDVLAEWKPGYVLMHTQGKPEEMQVNPRYKNCIEEILYFFEKQITFLTKAGLPEDRIVLDPGIGFGKTYEHTKIILKNIERFMVFGRPLFVGVSRKSMFKECCDLAVDERDIATSIAVALLASKGIAYHRVHDVKGCIQSLCLAELFAPFV